MSETPTPLLELRGITKSYGSVQALTDVDFEVRHGEVMALVGDNGAGKTTLIKCIAGIHGFDSGEILFEGAPVTISGPKDSAKLGIEVVYQDLALCDNLDVVQNMYLGREERDWLWRLKEPPMEQHTAETLKSLAVTTIRSTRQLVASLSGGQRQSVAVAKAVQWNSKLVILDEPTAALGVAQTRQVLDLVKRLAEQGLSVVLISHNLHDVFEVATRITVLRLGRDVGIYERDKDDAAGGRARDHRRCADQGRRDRGERAGARDVTEVEAEIAAPGIGLPEGDQPEAEKGIWQRTLDNLRTGNLGVLPIVLGLVLIVVFFGFKATNFFTADNFNNIIIQTAGTAMLAYGVVFVLLLGEIDLSIGYLSGLAAVSVAELQLPGGGPRRALRDRRADIGTARDPHRDRHRGGPRRRAGSDRGQGRRALVRRHAGRPADLPGRDPAPARGQGHDPHPGPLDQRHGLLLLLGDVGLDHRRDRHRPLRGDDR